MKRIHRKGFIDQQSYVAQYLALTLLTIGIVSTLGSDDLLAAFAAGCAISWDLYFTEQVEGESFAAVVDLVLNCACFVYIGAWMPFDTWATNLGQPFAFGTQYAEGLQVEVWRLVVLAIIILVIRRMPALLVLYNFIPEVEGVKQAFFAGHFGPVCNLYPVQCTNMVLMRYPRWELEQSTSPLMQSSVSQHLNLPQ
jgi:NhaP-type Na+/H+ or K+/H+ antiporter